MGIHATICYGFEIVEDDDFLAKLPFIKFGEDGDELYYEGDIMEDFEEWAPADCPFEIDMLGDLSTWSESAFILRLKGHEIDACDGTAVIDTSFFHDYAHGIEIHLAREWAVKHGIPVDDLSWILVPLNA